MADNDCSPDFEIVGQKITLPRTWPGVWSLVAVALTVLGVLAIVLVWAKQERVQQIVGFIESRISANGATVDSAVYQAGFWTPSPRTAEPVPGAQVSTAEPRDAWPGPVSESKVQVFGDSLFAKGLVKAFRRYEIIGRGRTPAKWGYWWVATLTHRLDRGAFAKFYMRYWNTREPVYVEELGGAHGTYETGGN